MFSMLKKGILVAIVVASSLGAVVTTAQNSDLVLDLQTVEVEGMRPVGLSPDGKLLAASDFTQDTLCIYTIDPFAEQVCADLGPLRSSLRLQDVSWSPDSTRLVMAERSFHYFKDGDLWVMDAFTGELSDVTDDGYEGDLQTGDDSGETYDFDVAPAWSPDGESITYSRSRWTGSQFQGNDIVTIPADGGVGVVLVSLGTDAPGVAYERMRWSADGASLFYTANWPQPDDPRNGIYRYDLATGDSELLVASHVDRGFPALVEVSPPGDRLLIYYPHLTGQSGIQEPIYWIVDLASVEVDPVPLPAGAGSSGYVGATTFSPDGADLLVGTRFTDPEYQLWQVDLTTGDATQLVENMPGVMVMDYAISPTWTESGRIFVAANIGSGTVVTVDARQGQGETPGATPAATILVAGDRVVVNSPGVPIYAAPTSMSAAVLLLSEGARLTVIGPPEEGDGVEWVPVQDETTRTIGFVRVEFIEAG